MLLKIVIPMAIQNLLVTIISASDAIMLGSLNAESLSAANLAGQVLQIYNYFIITLNIGTTALSAQYSGKNDLVSVKKILHITLQISIFFGIIFFLSCQLIPSVIMSFFTLDTALIALGSQYLRYVSFAFLFMSFSQVYLVILQNTGKVNLSALIGTSSVIINIVLNALLIFGLFFFPALGIRGAALATSIARLCEFIFTIIASSKKDNISFSIRYLFTHHKALEKKYIRYTYPSVVQSMSWKMGTIACLAILGHMSSEVIAANAVSIIVYDILVSIAIAYASGCGIILGQALGRGDLEDAKIMGDKMLRQSRIIGAVLGVIICACTPIVIALSKTLSYESLYYLRIMLIILGFKMVGKLNNTVLSKGILGAGGDVKFLMKVDIINMWLIIIPLSLIAAYILKLPVLVVYFIMNIDEYTKIHIENRRYKQYKWVKNLTKKEWAEPGRYDALLKDYIVKNMPFGALVIGASGKINLINDHAGEILGFDNDELEGLNFIKVFMEDSRNNDISQIFINALDKSFTDKDEIVNYYKGNTIKKLQIKTIFVEEEDTNIGILAIINDLTNIIN